MGKPQIISWCWWLFLKNLRYLFAGAIGSLFVLQFISPGYQFKHQETVMKSSESILIPTGYPTPKDMDIIQSAGHYNQYEQKDWQSTGHPDYKVWIYSAYSFDDKKVVILASPFPKTFYKGSIVQCAFHYSQSAGEIGHVKKKKGRFERMWAKGPEKTGTFIRCPLPTSPTSDLATATRRPDFVSVLLASQTESVTRVPIKYQNLNGTERPFQFAVCVNPLYGYNHVFHLIEWMEFYRMMGAGHFTFYNRSIGPATSCVLDHYTRNSLDGVTVKVNPWHNYPQRSDLSVRGEEAEGKYAGIHECFYSHRGLSKYMVFVDVDEFIVPSQGISNYHELMKHLEEISPPPHNRAKVGEYVFRNGFYIKSREKDPQLLDRCSGLRESFEEFQACKKLWTMQLVMREPLTSVPATEERWRNRTKFIVVPEAVKLAGAHFAWTFEGGWSSRKVDGDVAFSRHYRMGDILGKNAYSTTSTTMERISLDMGINLAKNVARSVKYFMKVCDLSLADVFG